jgi:hypothetical protein
MEFKAKIYIPNTKLNFFQKWALTEQLSFLSFVVAIFILIIEFFFSFDNILNDYIIVKIFYGLCIIPAMILNITYRYWEFERINGKLEGEISFGENGVKIDEKLYLFSEIKDFHISYGNVYNQPTGNKRIGPYLSQGLDNHISFYHNSKFIKIYFQLYATSQYDAIQKDLFYYVINEVFPFEKKNLEFIDGQFYHYTLYKEFIEKMKREGKLT